MMPYLRNTLQDYTQGEREMAKKMKRQLDLLLQNHGNQGLEQLLHFYANQR